MLLRVMHHGVRASVQFWCGMVQWYGSEENGRFYMEISEALPKMMAMNFGVL